ncbi:MAG: DUF4079 domain-containing protein [cyanobacterium endosymbiont of Rhopalodia musculus]|uniref:DUF4079 domain-containing protein n=1 Tax=cyanobacterium endosymbiont of Epithemia clementina EcSB TaxID=3034674 RepID=UPI0024813CED|nr:DUF4079 domain-containing protein [cyanobacterium endosymbiont of Epithemia clementina EcSB]WGT67031.1 DUF4079 domain-containing protein [cyanobacterium endosymbiont of Epithemia clementina EcSB]
MTADIPELIKVWSQFGHPILMWILFGLTIYTSYLGIQWRQTRTADKEVKKELLLKDFKTRHYQLSSLLLALMVMGNMGGMAITYINNGKLFVGPHLLVGLSLTVMIAVSASLSPLMQKGHELARYTHITLNIFIVSLFGWQAISGMDILTKIIDRMS